MNKAKRQSLLAVLIVAVILLADQVIKIWVKTHMCLGESIHVTDWFYIQFIENNGMAWGMTFFNKYVLSIFRILAVTFLVWYLHRLIGKKNPSDLYVALLAMVMAGAAGNIIDSLFYGLVFSQSYVDCVASVVPFGTGYGGFLTGRVVDMFYFPIIVSQWPDWMPVVGGDNFTFFNAIFNLADAAITVSVFALIIFCRKELAATGDDLELVFSRKKSNKEENQQGK